GRSQEGAHRFVDPFVGALELLERLEPGGRRRELGAERALGLAARATLALEGATGFLERRLARFGLEHREVGASALGGQGALLGGQGLEPLGQGGERRAGGLPALAEVRQALAGAGA